MLSSEGPAFEIVSLMDFAGRIRMRSLLTRCIRSRNFE